MPVLTWSLAFSSSDRSTSVFLTNATTVVGAVSVMP